MPCPGGAAHLPVVPVVDVAAVLHAVQCQVPPQGLHGMVVPLTGMGEGSRCMNQVGQCEIADPWGQKRLQQQWARCRCLLSSALFPGGRSGCR